VDTGEIANKAVAVDTEAAKEVADMEDKADTNKVRL
jgi:hypothetical protein